MSLFLIVAYALAFAVTGAVLVGLMLGEVVLLFSLFAYLTPRLSSLFSALVAKINIARVAVAFAQKHGLAIGWALIVLFFGVFFVGLFGFLPTNNPNLQFLPPLFPPPPPEPPPACP